MVKVAIFGSGTSAVRALQYLQSFPDFYVTTVADNNVEKHGDEWHGFSVCSASDLLSGGNWDVILIASSWHANILRQLLDMRVNSEKIAVFEPWGENGIVWGLTGCRWRNTFSERMGPDFIIPGFEGDFRVLGLLKHLGFEPKVILDIGASNGCWSVTCEHHFPESEYYLVEPMQQYDENLVDGYQADWHRLPIALGAEDKTVEMKYPNSKLGIFDASVARKMAEPPGESQTFLVQQARFDSLLNSGQIKIPDLVKIDVQGFEAEVLKGASSFWGAAEVFMVELSFRNFWKESKLLHEMIALFEAKGYLPFEFYHPYRNAEGLQSQIDCVFLKKDGKLANQHGFWNYS